VHSALRGFMRLVLQLVVDSDASTRDCAVNIYIYLK
jgi:hypothetical protein